LCDTLYGMVKRLLVIGKLGDALIIMGKWYKNLKKKIHVQQKHFGHYYNDQSCLWIKCGHVHVWGSDLNLKE
jgi:hypothetical protein